MMLQRNEGEYRPRTDFPLFFIQSYAFFFGFSLKFQMRYLCSSTCGGKGRQTKKNLISNGYISKRPIFLPQRHFRSDNSALGIPSFFINNLFLVFGFRSFIFLIALRQRRGILCRFCDAIVLFSHLSKVKE